MYYLQGSGKVPGRFLCLEAEGWHRRSTESRICHLTKKRAGQRNAHFLQTSVWQRGSPATNEKHFFGLLLFVRWREGRHRAKNEGLLLQMRQGECDGFHFPWRCHICKPRVLPRRPKSSRPGKGLSAGSARLGDLVAGALGVPIPCRWPDPRSELFDPRLPKSKICRRERR